MGRLTQDLATLAGSLALLGAAACSCGDGGGRGSSGTDTEGTTGPTTSAGTDTTGEPAMDPGRVTLHRLNRTEYNNTVSELFGIALTPATDFPSEDPSFGFDNIADVLTVSPLQLELYERAGDQMVEDALAIPIVEPQLAHYEAENISQDVGGECCGGFWNLWSNGRVLTTSDAPTDGDYTFRTRVAGQQGGPDLPHMVMEIDGMLVFEADIAEDINAPVTHEITVPLTTGSHQIAVGFTNDYYDANLMLDSNLLVDWLELEGPFGVMDGNNEVRERILTCDPVAVGDEVCLRQIANEFVARAWRRPLTAGEVDNLIGFLAIAQQEGEGFEAALRMMLKAALLSHNFLFRVELDDDPTSPTAHELSDYELASRLSYFIWSSMPDDALFEAAATGTLQDPAVLEAQARRMLADPRAQALVDNFAGQWLAIRAMDDVFKDVYTFPNFDDALRASMKRERELFFETFLSDDRPLTEMFTAKTTFVDSRLAALYGLPDPGGTGFSEVTLGENRQGLLTQAGLLTVLAHPETTSPVRRGKWVLDQLLCLSPPPPPPGVDIPPLEPGSGQTMREQLEQHRADPNCASCHAVMDPLGLPFEHYDPIGAWRDDDAGLTIDASGRMPDGREFDGVLELSNLLVDTPEFSTCTVRKSMIYATGRGMESSDNEYISLIAADFEAGGHKLSDLIIGIVTSEPFRMRRGEP